MTRFSGNGGSKGIDIANRRGTPIVATAPGQVVYAGAGLRGYGKLIIIKHSKHMLSAYGHQDEIYVKEGQMVNQSHLIGRMEIPMPSGSSCISRSGNTGSPLTR